MYLFLQLDAWKLADPYVKIRNSEGQEFSLSSASLNPSAHEKLTDAFVEFKITEDLNPLLRPAQQIIQRINRRDFYKEVTEINLDSVCERIKNMKNDEVFQP